MMGHSIGPQDKSATSVVLSGLRNAILTGAHRPGTVLSRSELAAQFETSQTPVREALLLLEAEGMVHVRPRAATRVAPIRLLDVHQAQFARRALEVAVVRRLASDPDKRDLTSIKTITITSRETFHEADAAFHNALFTSLGMAEVLFRASGLFVPLERCRALRTIDASLIAQSQSEHEDIVSRIKATDPDGSARAMEAHLANEIADLYSLTVTHADMFSKD